VKDHYIRTLPSLVLVKIIFFFLKTCKFLILHAKHRDFSENDLNFDLADI
jgi:hypothetical protein